MKLNPQDLPRRRPVWEAMSEFFLDTELDAADDARIAGVLAASGYSIEELDRILWDELCPVLHENLGPVAGEWAGFDMQQIEEQIVNHPAGALRRWYSDVMFGSIAKHAWDRVRRTLVTSKVS